MKQHPIPQNVLDVEFKLFTKFTLKEFGYLAAGILTGSLFLLLNRQANLPGIIAWPAFLLLSGLGAFFALVPINDQGADEFVKNYFTAINKPTQRVWLNDQMKEQRSKPVINADVDNKKVIGTDLKKKNNIFEEKPGDDILDTKENKNEVTEKETVQSREDSKKQEVNIKRSIVISPQNIGNYQFQIQSVDSLPGNINIWLADMNNRGIPDIPTYLRDKEGKVLFANKTGSNGYFLLNKTYPPGMYYIQFDTDKYNIPTVQIILEGRESRNPIKIIGQLK